MRKILLTVCTGVFDELFAAELFANTTGDSNEALLHVDMYRHSLADGVIRGLRSLRRTTQLSGSWGHDAGGRFLQWRWNFWHSQLRDHIFIELPGIAIGLSRWQRCFRAQSDWHSGDLH